MTIWQIAKVLPLESRLEEVIVAFPEELAKRLILLFSHKGEIVLGPFLGSSRALLLVLGQHSGRVYSTLLKL
ncbi:MAG: DNA methyltransferase [Candidatus Fervidibacter sp.]|uniref:DNA methyltransferase n=1 Tax=Candidatus Fervidibacter sp. TaxID=3100871 RepID=UPI00404B400B